MSNISGFYRWVKKTLVDQRKYQHTVIHSPYFVDAQSNTSQLYHCTVYNVVVTQDYVFRITHVWTLNLN